jgi:F-type H+-transporting ATPase subunit b
VRRYGAWFLIFVSSLVFTFYVDLGDNFFGLPERLVQVLFAANLTLFLWLLARFVGRPMTGFLDSRRDEISEQLQRAQQRLGEAEQLRAEVRARLAQVEQEVAQLTERAGREGEAEARQISDQTAHEEQRFLKRVEDEIARRQAEARADLAQETAVLTAQLTRELLQRELTDDDRQRILDRSLAAMRPAEED